MIIIVSEISNKIEVSIEARLVRDGELARQGMVADRRRGEVVAF